MSYNYNIGRACENIAKAGISAKDATDALLATINAYYYGGVGVIFEPEDIIYPSIPLLVITELP